MVCNVIVCARIAHVTFNALIIANIIGTVCPENLIRISRKYNLYTESIFYCVSGQQFQEAQLNITATAAEHLPAPQLVMFRLPQFCNTTIVATSVVPEGTQLEIVRMKIILY